MIREKIETNVNTIVDSETGEVLDSTVRTNLKIEAYRKCNKDEFIMIYLQDISGFLRIDNGTQIKLLAILWKEVNYNNSETNNGNVITALLDDKKRWAEYLNVTTRTIDNTISALVKKQLLLPEARGKYKLNPQYFFKGSSKDRMKMLDLRINYDVE